MSITTELQLITNEFATQIEMFSVDMPVYITFVIGGMIVLLIIALLTILLRIARTSGGV